MHVHHSVEDLSSPFTVSLSELELRETAYEIVVAACRSSELKPLTFISHSHSNNNNNTTAPQRKPSLHRSLTCMPGGSKVKKELGLKTSSSVSEGKKVTTTMGGLMRVQMRVSDLTDTRIRRALLRVAARQVEPLISAANSKLHLYYIQGFRLQLWSRLRCGRYGSIQSYYGRYSHATIEMLRPHQQFAI